jgi:hypothetical protein
MASSSENVNSVVERILSLLFDANRNQQARLSVFIGAGVSREYGIPTTLGFAKRFFEEALSGLDQKARAAIRSTSDEEQIRKFIEDFKERLDSDLAYAFFKQVEQDSLNQVQANEIITYDRLIDLWRNGYIKIVVTTNFDALIEQKFSSREASPGCPAVELTILDYHDLARTDRPSTIAGATLVKIAGQIERSNMLWTEEDFVRQLTDEVLNWLAIRIADTPVLMLGYTASEPPLAELLAKHAMYAASVVPQPLEDVASLSDLARRRAHLHEHVASTASQFVAALYESLYQRTKNPNLALSYNALRDRIDRLNTERALLPPAHHVVRVEAYGKLREFAMSRDAGKRCLVLLGESGFGKSTLVHWLARRSTDDLVIHIPSSELNHSLDEWLSRLDNVDIGHICRLTKLLGKNLVLAIDALNECPDTSRAKAVLQDVIRVLDLYNDGHVRVIVTSRTDYWNRLRFDAGRTYLAEPFELGVFTHPELAEAVRHLGDTDWLELPRWRYVRDLLRVPQLFGFCTQLGATPLTVGSEPALYRALREERQEAIADADRTLLWLCKTIRENQRLSVPLIETDLDRECRASITELASAGMLSLNRFETLRFAEDRMGEFIFGGFYLYEYCWGSVAASQGADIRAHFRGLVEQYKRLGREALEYKIHFFNSLIFFAARCNDDEIVLLHSAGTNFEKTLIRAAVVLRRSIEPRPELQDDPVMMAVSVLDKRHYDKLLSLLIASDATFLSGIPFQYGAKLFPEQFLDFIEFLAERITEQKITLETDHRYSTVLINSVLIYILRNGPEQLSVRPRLRDFCRWLVGCSSTAFLGARIAETLEQNSRYLFHYHPTDKASDLLRLDWYWKQLLIEALKGSFFQLPTRDVRNLLRQSAAVRLVLRFVGCRDIKDTRLTALVDDIFRSGDIVAQDFCLGLLGWAGKQDAAFISLSEACLSSMRTQAGENFFRRTIGTFDGADSQYDPLVPHVTTLMLRGLPVELPRLIAERDERAAFRVGRLAQKTMLDFPEETLTLIYRFLDTGQQHEEIRVALRAAARFSPGAFWRTAQQRRPDDLFELDGDEIDEITRIVAQVRDFDWCNVISWATATPERKTSISRLLLQLIRADNLDHFFQVIIEQMAPAPESAEPSS